MTIVGMYGTILLLQGCLAKRNRKRQVIYRATSDRRAHTWRAASGDLVYYVTVFLICNTFLELLGIEAPPSTTATHTHTPYSTYLLTLIYYLCR
ncbi:hypothetical protein GGS21DRAFT_163548 [Xylaria nigripes]|nr:hypothetical protein GGS21DRAFT_163548 [Xylaria nigripes]